MFNFFKKVFSKKSQPEPKPKPVRVHVLLKKFINLSIDKEELKSNFPKRRREVCSRHLEEGLQALNQHGVFMRKEQRKVNKVKIINLLKLIITYGDKLETDGVKLEKK